MDEYKRSHLVWTAIRGDYRARYDDPCRAARKKRLLPRKTKSLLNAMQMLQLP